MLDLVSKYASKNDVPMPPALFIDHGLHFSETWDFLKLASNFWKINIIVAKNENVLSNVINGNIDVDKLNSDNKRELKVLNYTNNTIPYSLHTEVANPFS